MYSDGIVVGRIRLTPCGLEELLFGKRALRVRHERGDQFELDGREVKRKRIHGERMARGVEAPVVEGEYSFARGSPRPFVLLAVRYGGLCRAPAKLHIDTGGKFVDVERFADVIVCAHAQQGHAVGAGGAR